MPELPDVETFKRYLDATSLHRKIKDVEVKNTKVLEGVSARGLKEALVGRKFAKSRRYGKNLLIELDQGPWLRMHFGMTGFLKYLKDSADAPGHTRVLFSFRDGTHLAYVCQRMLGSISLEQSPSWFIKEHELGADAMEIHLEEFNRILKNSRGAVKTFLMNQKLIAGLGNIYSDEVLFQAGILPQARSGRMDENQVRKLYQAMRRVLKTTIRHRADPERFPRSYLIPRRKQGAECPRCSRRIKRIKINQRSAYFCPACQKQP